MRFRPPLYKNGTVHPPPSFWSTSALDQCAGFSPDHQHAPAHASTSYHHTSNNDQSVEEKSRRFDRVTASTVSSARRTLQQVRRQRRRQRQQQQHQRSTMGSPPAASPTAAVAAAGAGGKKTAVKGCRKLRRGRRASPPCKRCPPTTVGREEYRSGGRSEDCAHARGREGDAGDRTISPIHGGQMEAGLFDDTASTRQSGSPHKGTPEVGIGGPEAGSVFLKLQRALLSQLEALYVTIADDRMRGLAALRQEEAMWKEAAKERARKDLHCDRLALEERLRERVVEQGPGVEAMKAVGLARAGGKREAWMELTGGTSGLSDTDGKKGFLNAEGTGWGVGWKLPSAMVEGMRLGFQAKMERESAQVLEEENKALLNARACLARREGARTERELSDLSQRLTNDGRDALAALRAKLELDTDQRMAEERRMLKENLACALEQERDRLLTERNLRIADARDNNRREISERAAALRETAAEAASRRQEEAVELLDGAAERARSGLEALLKAQADKGLEEIRGRCSRERKACVSRAREKGERECRTELETLADSVRKKNEGWMRLMRRELGDALRRKGKEGGEDSISPALQLRAVEAADDCARLGRRLVELVMKEAAMRLQDSALTYRGRERKRDRHSAINIATLGLATCTGSQSPREEVEITASGSGGAPKGCSRPKTFAAASTQKGRTGRDQGCVNCDRLSKANTELKNHLWKRSKEALTSVRGTLTNPKTKR